MDCKRRYTRDELTEEHDEFLQRHCVLCKAVGVGTAAIVHAEDCVLADASVCSLVFIKSRAGIVFRLRQNRWWWVSAASGKEYHVEKLPGRYAMFDTAGNTIVERHRLSDIRMYLALNQGRL